MDRGRESETERRRGDTERSSPNSYRGSEFLSQAGYVSQLVEYIVAFIVHGALGSTLQPLINPACNLKVIFTYTV